MDWYNWLQIAGLIAAVLSAFRAGQIIGYTTGYSKGQASVFVRVIEKENKSQPTLDHINYD